MIARVVFALASVLFLLFTQSADAADQSAEVAERLSAYAASKSFAETQSRKVISALAQCRSYPGAINNTDFNPKIPFVLREAAHGSFRLKLPALAFVDTTDGNITRDILSVSGGLVTILDNQKSAAPEIRDGVFILQENGVPCAARARLSFAPIPSGANYTVVNIIGRRGPDTTQFTIPYGSEFRNDNGNLLVTDCTNGVVQEFSLHGDLVNWFGGIGKKPGQFDLPADIKFSDGKIYVVEEGNDRLQILDGDGKSLSILGVPPSDPKVRNGLFNRPLGVAIGAGRIYVSDYGSGRIKQVQDGKVSVISDNKPGDPFEFNDPYYVDVDPSDGNLLVTNRGANEIAVLDSTGKKLAHFGSGVLNFPHELTVGPDHRIYIADMLNNRVAIFSNRSEKNAQFLDFPASWGTPKTVAINRDGLIAVGFAGGDESFVALVTLGVAPEQLSMQAPRKIANISLGADQDRSTSVLYERHCANCHERGVFHAPKRGDINDWKRFPKNVSDLLPLAIAGKGAMIPKGGCATCTEKELSDLISYIVPSKWSE